MTENGNETERIETMSDKVKCEKCHLMVDHTMLRGGRQVCGHCISAGMYAGALAAAPVAQKEEEWRGVDKCRWVFDSRQGLVMASCGRSASINTADDIIRSGFSLCGWCGRPLETEFVENSE